MHTQPFSDPAVASCLRTLAAAYPAYVVRSCRYAQQGWDSLTLLVNDDTIFRFARRPDVATRLAREAALLPALAPTLPRAIPRFAYTAADPAGGTAFVGYPALPGEPLSDDLLAGPHAPTLAGELGAFLAALHSFPADEARRRGILGGDAAAWRDEYRTLYDEIREQVFPLLTAGERRAVAARWQAYLDDGANFTFTPSLIHRDLGPEHILHDPTAGHLTGIIDWGDASIGDPALDFTGVASEIGTAFAASALTAYGRPVTDSFARRVQFYAFVVPFHEIRFGQYESDATHIQQGLAHLRRSLADTGQS